MKNQIKGNIICFSTADWDTLLPTNKHQLMRRMAARGWRVLFVETLGTRAPKLASSTDLSRIGGRLKRGFEGPKRREKRLWTLSPIVRPAWNSRPAIELNRRAFQLQAAKYLKKFSSPVVWIYSPYAVHLLDLIEKPKAVIYHMVDDLAAVPGADQKALRQAESLLLARADAVLCTERSLYDRARRISDDAHFMPNVADYKHFSRSDHGVGDARLARLQSLPRPRLVFSGNLAPHKVDFELLEKLARRRKDWSFSLIGPVWEGAGTADLLKPLRKLSNVYLPGHVPYNELPPYLHAADVLLIPYVRSRATEAVFPLKLFEYLATGRPVVASKLPSLQPYKGAIRLAESPKEWEEAISLSLRDTHEMELQRRALARRYTWDKRIQQIEEILAEK